MLVCQIFRFFLFVFEKFKLFSIWKSVRVPVKNGKKHWIYIFLGYKFNLALILLGQYRVQPVRKGNLFIIIQDLRINVRHPLSYIVLPRYGLNLNLMLQLLYYFVFVVLLSILLILFLCITKCLLVFVFNHFHAFWLLSDIIYFRGFSFL